MKKNLITIDPIFVRNKKEVVEAFEILDKIGMAFSLSTEEQRNKYLSDETRTIENNYIVQEDGDDGYRVQSHYIGNGISIESLREQVNGILVKYPNIKEQIETIRKRNRRIKNLELKLREDLKKEIENLDAELKENLNIEINEKK